MILLCAYWKGAVKQSRRAEHGSYVREVHLPLVATWPKLRRLRLQANDGKAYEGEVPQYRYCFELAYDSHADLAESLASDARKATRERSIADASVFKEPFQGEVLHMVYETSDFPTGSPGDGHPKMLRCAYYMGTVPQKDRARFDRYCSDVHLPDVANWPHLRSLRLLKNEGQDFLGEPPRYYHCFELGFNSQAEMNACMASEARKETRRVAKGDFDSFKGLFQGEVHHVNYTVTEIPVAPRKAS